MTEVPSRLVADPKRALNLASRHALFGFAKQAGCKEPLPQRQVGIVKDSLGRHAELVRASIANKLIALENTVDLAGAAFKALWASGPAKAL